MAALVNPVGDSIRSSLVFGVNAATSPRAAASLGRRIGSSLVGLYARLLWRLCVLWPRLAAFGFWLVRGSARELHKFLRRAERSTAPQQPHLHSPSAAERARELVRGGVTYWLVRPAMRLSALVVERTAQALPAGIGLSVRSAGSDGLVDTAGQRGIDVPAAFAGRRTRSMGSMRSSADNMRTCHSSDHLESLGSSSSSSRSGGGGSFNVSPRSSRGSPVARRSSGAKGSGGKGLPQRGKWWVLHVQDADHSLGTALCQESGPMYEDVLSIIERLPPLDTRELMRMRAARLSDETFSDPHVPRCEEVVG